MNICSSTEAFDLSSCFSSADGVGAGAQTCTDVPFFSLISCPGSVLPVLQLSGLM